MNYYLDSNICIYFLKGIYPLIKEKIVSTNPSTIKIPSIVKAELLYGAEKSQQKAKNLSTIKLFLEPFEIVPFDEECSIVYSKIRSAMELKGMMMGPNDIIIAATVLAKNGVLVTNNTNKFEKVKNLKLENWTVK